MGTFHGATVITLDAKGRLAVPTRHREPLASDGGELVLTAHPDGCVLLYPRRAWDPVRAQVEKFPSFNSQTSAWKRLLLGFEEHLRPDSSGRILVSPALRSHASLERDVILLGQGQYFELWDDALRRAKQEKDLASGSGVPPGMENFSL